MNATPQFHLVLAYKKKKAVKEGKAKIVICVLSASDSERWEQMCSEADKKLNTLALQGCHSPGPSSGQALELFFDNVFEYPILQSEVGYDTLELT